VVAYSTEERLCREAEYGASAAPPSLGASAGLEPRPHPEPYARTAAKAHRALALAAAGPLPALPGLRHAPPRRPGIDDGALATASGRAQARLVLAGMGQATALWAQAANAHAGNPLAGWSGGCPGADIRIVTHGGHGGHAAWRRRHAGALARATRLVATTSAARDAALDDSQPHGGPLYGVKAGGVERAGQVGPLKGVEGVPVCVCVCVVGAADTSSIFRFLWCGHVR
jgi:hypothetical protein